MNEGTPSPNRLINETSPYLLQHAYNPVDWYPWGPEALERAKNEDRLILLSIGYSACHWCHVMERESFEDEEIAEIMNENYICIKVDREERPDLDKVYQTAHQMFNQRAGGWPLTAFLTPDEHTPVYVGTYFPDTPRAGMPSFGNLLENVAEQYQEKKQHLAQHNKVIKDAFARLRTVASNSELPLEESLMESAVQELFHQYDPVYGGFGDAPKFPHPTQLILLLAFGRRQQANAVKKERAIDITVHTLEAMANGGLRDQIGGGFCRYSVDAMWEIPHFEKMLYDNAQLLPVYADAGILNNRQDFLDIAVQTGEWVMREMQSENGGYFSTIDADSEGAEGKFYVWTVEELKEKLSYEEFKVVDIRYGLRGEPNFEDNWHLRVANPLSVVAERSGIPSSEIPILLESARQKLFSVRSRRVPPDRDEKILASWNGLMVKAMARAGRLLKRPDFIDSAAHSLEFVRTQMWKNGRLLATAKDNRAHLNAYLDDYAFLADGILELLQARWSNSDLSFAMELLDVLLDQFTDPTTGAFHFTSDDHETLLHRAVPTHDEATPSGNGIAAQVLAKAAYLLGENRYMDAATKTMHALHPAALHLPSAFGTSVIAIEETINPSPIVVIRGKIDKINEWADACSGAAPLNTMVFPIPLDADEGLPGLLKEKSGGTDVVAYLCSGFTCSAPCSSLEELNEMIGNI